MEENSKWKQLIAQAYALLLQPLKQLPQDEIDRLLEGHLTNLKPQKRVVRVFTSSTFTDTKAERNFLMKYAFPFLRQLCLILGLEYQVVDMRWGVLDDRSDDHGTSELCLHEVKNCLDLSLSIAFYFIAFLGNKYGYRPFPVHIEAVEFEKLRSELLNDPDLHFIDEWYKRDENSIHSNTCITIQFLVWKDIPPQYVLRPIREILTKFRVKDSGESNTWWSVIFPKIQMMLRQSALKCLPPNIAHKYVQSVTEEEVRKGIVTNPNIPQVFFFDREYDNLPTDHKETGLFVDTAKGAIDTEAVDLLAKLKKEVHNLLPEAQQGVYKFRVDWPKRVVDESDLNFAKDPLLHEIADIFCREIGEATLREYEAQNYEFDAVIKEIIHHQNLALSKCASYVDRKELTDQVMAYTSKNPSPIPYIIHGKSGSGKTTFVANAALRTKRENPSAVVVVRFIGTSSESGNGRQLLYSISQQIFRVYGKDPSTVPRDYESLSRMECLSLATQDKPLFLILDSLDQLSDQNFARNMGWIPLHMPPFVHIILSTLPDIGGCFNALVLKYPKSTENFLEIPVLSSESTGSVLTQLMRESNRSLTLKQQESAVALIGQCPLPLYIRLMADSCLKLLSYQEFMPLPTTIPGLIHLMLDKIESYHGELLVSHALSYITCAKHGLTQNELEDLLACDDEVLEKVYQWWTPPERRLPPLLWVRIRTDLSRYLVERGADGFVVYSWYHRQWTEVVRERYLNHKPEYTKQIHQSLADYFQGKWKDGKPYTKNNIELIVYRGVDPQPLFIGGTKPNIRKLSELPYHQTMAGNLKELAEFSLGDINFCSAKVQSGRAYELIEDYLLVQERLDNGTLQATSPEAKAASTELKHYHRFIQSNLHILGEDTLATWQLAMDAPEDSVVFTEAVKFSPKNRFFVQRHNKEPDTCLLTISIQTKDDGQHTINRDISTAATFCKIEKQPTIFLWNLRTGSSIARISIEEEKFVFFSWDKKLLFALGSTLSKFSSTGALISDISYTDILPKAVMGCSGPNEVIAMWGAKILVLCDYSSGLKVLQQQKGIDAADVYFMQFATDSVVVLILKDPETLVTWNIQTDTIAKRDLGEFRANRGVDIASISNNGKFLVYNSGGCLVNFNLETLQPIWVRHSKEKFILASFTLDDSKVLFTTKSYIVSVPINSNGREKPETLGQAARYSNYMQLMPDGNMIFLQDKPNFANLYCLQIKIQELKVLPPFKELPLSPDASGSDLKSKKSLWLKDALARQTVQESIDVHITCAADYLGKELIKAAEFSHNENFLVYRTFKGVSVYDYTKKESNCVINFRRMFYSNVELLQTNFSNDDTLLVISLSFTIGRQKLGWVIVYDLEKKEKVLLISQPIQWAAFCYRSSHTMLIVAPLDTVYLQWWTLDGRLIGKNYIDEPTNRFQPRRDPTGHLGLDFFASKKTSLLLGPYEEDRPSTGYQSLLLPAGTEAFLGESAISGFYQKFLDSQTLQNGIFISHPWTGGSLFSEIILSLYFNIKEGKWKGEAQEKWQKELDAVIVPLTEKVKEIQLKKRRFGVDDVVKLVEEAHAEIARRTTGMGLIEIEK